MASQPRLFCETPLSATTGALTLPERAARHAQVLRLQPGEPVTLFDGRGGEWTAVIREMGRRDVFVELQSFDPTERELPARVTIAAGMPANERFDWLIEKAAELGASAIQPLTCERSVLRVSGERADRKRAHWQGIAVAAAEQCGRTRVPVVHPPLSIAAWLDATQAAPPISKWLLSPVALQRWNETDIKPGSEHVVLSGPEGGLSAAEEHRAQSAGFVPVRLGPLVLRAETAPLVALSSFAIGAA